MTAAHSLPPQAVFVDTGAFYAWLDRRDRWHREARRCFEDLAREERPLAVSNLILAETYTLVRKRLGHRVAIRWLDSLDINLILQTEADHHQVCALLARYEDKDFSYTDALSFVLMERLGVRLAFTFDAHFRQYGLDVLP